MSRIPAFAKQSKYFIYLFKQEDSLRWHAVLGEETARREKSEGLAQ